MKIRISYTLILVLLLGGWWNRLPAQQIAVKTNVPYWATTTPNVSLEAALDAKTTIDLQLSFNPWQYGSKEDNKKLQHWLIQPELRRWIYEKYDGHFFGVHSFFGRYNAGGIKLPLGIFGGMENNRYEGYGIGAGLSYGYQWYLSSHWNLEATFGFGYAYLNYDRFECRNCGEHQLKTHKHYFGPTRLGVSVIYLFKSQK